MLPQKHILIISALLILHLFSFGQENDSVIAKPGTLRLSHVDMALSYGGAWYKTLGLSTSICFPIANNFNLGLKIEGAGFDYEYLGVGPNMKYRFIKKLSSPYIEVDFLLMRIRQIEHDDYYSSFNYETNTKVYNYWGGRGILFLGFNHRLGSTKLTLDFKYGMGYQYSKCYRSMLTIGVYGEVKEIHYSKYLAIGLSYFFNDPE
jgi:hypothetical protein